MPIPESRDALTSQLDASFTKLRDELDASGPGIRDLPCVDDWSVKDLLAIRVWWTESVVSWVEAGVRGERPVTPAPGYRWKDTPRLNADVVARHRRSSYRSLRERLDRGFLRVNEVIVSLDDESLLGVGVFPWAGNYPVARWIAINTIRQYVTARTYIRRAIRERR